jgi:hypothetical protein
VQQISSLEKLIVNQVVKKILFEPEEYLLLPPQEPTTGPYLQPGSH